MKLKVAQAQLNDVYKDMARVSENLCLDSKDSKIPEGKICKVSVKSKNILLVLRGKQKNDEDAIYLDDKTRIALGVNVGESADFVFEQASWKDELIWTWQASDPAYRVSARLGIISVGLALLSFIPVLRDFLKSLF